MSDAAAWPTPPLHQPTVVERPEEVTAKVNAGSTEVVPEVEIKLFVGRVPHTVDDNQLRCLFSLFGRVTDVMIMRDKQTNVHKGAAFVRLASIAHADAAIRALNNVFALDPAMGALQVRYAVGEAEKLNMPLEAAPPGLNSAKLFVGSLPRLITEDAVRELFAPFGAVEEIYVMRDAATSQSKGCAFVKMAYKEQAHLAVKRLDGTQPLLNTTRPLEVRFAESRRNNSGGGFHHGGQGGNNDRPRQQQHAPAGHHQQQQHAPQPQQQQQQSSSSRQYGTNENPRIAGSWKEYFTDDGRPYYYCDKTFVTQWDRPLEFDRLENVYPPSGRQPPSAAAAAAAPIPQQEDVAGPPGANIFVFHVPNDWTRDDLIHVFEPFGYILSARIATDKVSQRNKGYAFVSYDNIQSAVDAVTHMDGLQATPNKKLKVAIKQNEEAHVAHLMPPAANNNATDHSTHHNTNKQTQH